MEEIVKGSPYVNGDVLMAEDMNAIVNALLDNGSIKLPVVSKEDLDVDKSAIAALADKSEAIGWCMYTVDGEKIEFAEEMPESATFLGAISAVDASGEEPIVTVVAPTSAVFGNTGGDDAAWCGIDYIEGGIYYASVVGSYDADGNRLSTETEGVEGTAFTIKANSSNTNVDKAETDSDFQTDFGTATAEQRQLAMVKLHGSYAADACHNYQPAASVINMRGIWRLPIVNELTTSRNKSLATIKAHGSAVSGNSTWSSLENDSTYAWGVSMGNGSTYNSNKGYEYVVRAFCRL